MLNSLEYTQQDLEIYVDREELNGHLVSEKYYQTLMDNVHQQANQLRAQREEMIKTRDDLVNAGKLVVGTPEWDEQNAAINEVSLSIHELGNQWREYYNAIRETKWETFDILQDRISSVADEAQFLIDLMSNEKLFEDNGQLTDKGMATMGLYGEQYNILMNQADRYAQEIKEIEKQMAEDPADLDLADRYYELVEAQQEAILSAEDMKNSIKDLVEEGIDLELQHLDDLIDKYLEALQAQEDLYDYQNEVSEKTQDIASLEKQLSAYANDNSEEAKATIQKLTNDLNDARKDLADTEREQAISDIERILDTMRNDYETILNMRLDNIDALIADMIEYINMNASSINEVISAEAANVGYQLSEETQAIWDSSNGTQDVLKMYGEGFLTNGTTIANTLEKINVGIQNMITALNNQAQQNIQSTNDNNANNIPVAKPTPPANNNNNNNNNQQQEQPKQVTVGGRINAGSARIYADSYGNGGGRQYFANDPIYVVLQKSSRGYILVRHHSQSKGYTGWFKESDVKALATGKRKLEADQLAWTQEEGAEMIVRPSDGAILTPLAKNDSVLNADATRNIWNMANNPSDFVKDNLGFAKDVAPSVASGGTANYTQNLKNVVFNLPNVQNYEQLLASMQKDKNFERLISSMTIDKIAGKSSLTKSKAIR